MNKHNERAEFAQGLRDMAYEHQERGALYKARFLMQAAALLEAQPMKPLTDEQIETLAKPFIRDLGGDHWLSGEDGIPDRGQVEEFARAIEAAHGIKEQA